MLLCSGQAQGDDGAAESQDEAGRQSQDGDRQVQRRQPDHDRGGRHLTSSTLSLIHSHLRDPKFKSCVAVLNLGQMCSIFNAAV